jgi:transcriptional regulator of acetoin/glycerol metabolism
MSQYSRELSILRDQHAELIEAAASEIAPYFNNMLHNVQCVVLLADTAGTILQIWHPEDQPMALFRALQPGNTWGEVHADSATPVFDANGRQSGALCLHSTTKMGGYYTLGMMKLVSHGIENRLLLRTYQGEAHILKLNTNPSSLDSNWAGLLIVDHNGIVCAANRRAHSMLDEQLVNISVKRIFGLEPETLMQAVTSQPAKLVANGDHQVFVQLCTEQTFTQTPVQQEKASAENRESADAFWAHRGERRVASIPDNLIPEDVVAPENLEHGDTRVRRLIRQADGGTLFLDEIGEMPLMLQSRLLRVLQQRVVTPLGSTESYPVNIKLISATNRSLRENILAGHFRQDLYYRIAGLNLELPSLRERSDIKPLITFVHQRLLQAEPGPSLSQDMLNLLARHPWPGNMRQLVHALQVGMAMADGALLEKQHLPDDFFVDAREPVSLQTEPHSELLPRLYRANGGNISRTARAAGVSRNTVYKYLRSLEAG